MFAVFIIIPAILHAGSDLRMSHEQASTVLEERCSRKTQVKDTGHKTWGVSH